LSTASVQQAVIEHRIQSHMKDQDFHALDLHLGIVSVHMYL